MANPLTDLVRFLAAMGFADATRNQLLPPPAPVVALTTARTLVATDKCGTIFTNRGAVASVTLTIPSPTLFPAGFYFEYYGVAGQNFLVATLTADTLITFNDVAADSVGIQTAGALIGAHAKVVSDGTSWIYSGDTVGVTYTVVT